MSNIFDLFKKIEKSTAKSLPVTHIVVGLGNPGREYEKTRHNAGFMAIDYIAYKYALDISHAKFHALVGEGDIEGVRILFMKPTTCMNNSGVAIAEAASFYKIAPENIIVLCDEISFDVGVMRIRRKGSSGGHNGLKSIIEHLGSDAFPRIKIGVGQKPSADYDLVKWVLGRFPEQDLDVLSKQNESVLSAIKLMIVGKIDDAMCKFSR